jgi:hypothetical protein
VKISEKPIQPGTLTKVKELTGGHKGMVFLLENKAGDKLVVKFQHEPTFEAIGGTAVMKKGRCETPGVREATAAEFNTLASAGTGWQHDSKLCEKFVKENPSLNMCC